MRRYGIILILLPLFPSLVYSQTVHSLVVDKACYGDVYASTYCGGIWRTSSSLTGWVEQNNGLSIWQPVTSYTILSSAIAPSHCTIMYCGNSVGHVYRSDDYGDTWSQTGLNLKKGIRAIGIDPADTEHVFAASEKGLYAHNHGTGWQKVFCYGRMIVKDVAFDIFDHRLVYAAASVPKGGGILFRSPDSGISWDETPFDYGINRIGLDPHTEGTVYLASVAGVYKTVDDGFTWVFYSAGLPDKLITAIVIDPINAQVVYVGTMEGVYASVDGGLSWFNTGIVDAVITDLSFSKDEISLYIATVGNGVIKHDITK